MSKFKNKILISFTILAAIAVIIGTTCIIHEYIMTGCTLTTIGTVWIILFMIANKNRCWRIMRKLKKPILSILTFTAVILMIAGTSCVQNDMYLKGVILFLIGLVWILLFLKANPKLCWDTRNQ